MNSVTGGLGSTACMAEWASTVLGLVESYLQGPLGYPSFPYKLIHLQHKRGQIILPASHPGRLLQNLSAPVAGNALQSPAPIYSR